MDGDIENLNRVKIWEEDGNTYNQGLYQTETQRKV